MNNKSYREDESLMGTDQNQQNEVNEDLPQDGQYILPQENNEIDELEETQNITFNFINTKTIKIEIPNFAILFSLQRHYLGEFKQLLTRLELNFFIVKEGLIIKTDSDEKLHEGIKNEINKYLKTIYTKKLALDYDSQRTFFRSTFIQNQCSMLEYYIVKQKNSDQNIEIHLVSKKESINIVAFNLEQKLKGLRIFFLDVVNHMTSPKVNIDYKNLLGNLRQNYFQKIMQDELEKLFSKNLEFVDVIDKQKPFCSCLLGFHFPANLQGKSQLCQEIYQYVIKKIESLFVIFISFTSQGDNIQQARYIENLITNFKQKNRFLCACQVDLSLKVIGILSTPEGIKIIANELLKQKKNEFSKEFIRTLAVNILKKNFECNSTKQKGSFQTQIADVLQKKKEIEIQSQEQLYTIKFISKVTFESYCNLISYISDIKIKQESENILDNELCRIIKKIEEFNLQGKFFEQLEKMPDQNQNQNQRLRVRQIEEATVSHNKSQLQQPRIEQPIKQQKIPQNQKLNSEQNLNRQSTIDTVDDKKEFQENILNLFQNSDQSFVNEQEAKIIFTDPIVQEIKDGTGRITISEKYQEHFKKLIGENQPKNGYICIKERDLMQLKVFDNQIKIYPEVQYVDRSQDEIIIEVQVNGNAEKKIIKIFEEQNNQDQFYMVNQNNQILPYKKMEN